MIKKILTYPDENLNVISDSVINFETNFCKNLVDDLIDTLKQQNGIGLAAPQVGVTKRVVVICANFPGFVDPSEAAHFNLYRDHIVIINPVMDFLGDSTKWNEACLSVPGYFGEVVRSTGLKLSYQDLTGKMHEVIIGWPLAGVIQHECDHLDGILYIDRMINFKGGKNE